MLSKKLTVSLMVLRLIKFNVLLCLWFSSPSFAQKTEAFAEKNFLDATEPERNFFMKQLGDCPNCQTLTIVVSDERLSENLIVGFRAVANRLGKDNAGTFATTYDLWKNWKIFANHGCSGIEQSGDRYVIFLDRGASFCVVFPFKHEKHVLAVVSIIERSLGDRAKIDPNKWRHVTTASIENYFRSNNINDPFYANVFALVRYVTGILHR
jgi:hypothetical protein